MKLLYLIIPSFFYTISFAQKKVNIDLNFSVYKSIGNETVKNYKTSDGYVRLEHFDKKRFKNPFISFTANASYLIFKKTHVGLQTGIYNTFYETYISYPPQKHYSIPLQVTLKYEIVNKPKSSFGVIVAAGINFFNIYELTHRYKNGALYNSSFYYKIGRNNFKFGIEKQIDNVTVYLKKMSSYTTENTYQHKIKRVSAYISYGFSIK